MSFLQVNCGKKKSNDWNIDDWNEKKKKQNQRTETNKTQKVSFTF